MIARAWADLWPNIVAPSLWTLLGIGLAHAHSARQHRRVVRIAADTHLALTGLEHPDAPQKGA